MAWLTSISERVAQAQAIHQNVGQLQPRPLPCLGIAAGRSHLRRIVPLKLLQQLSGFNADGNRQILGIVELCPVALGDERRDDQRGGRLLSLFHQACVPFQARVACSAVCFALAPGMTTQRAARHAPRITYYVSRFTSATTIPARISPHPIACRGPSTSPISRKLNSPAKTGSAAKISAVWVAVVKR